MSSQIIEHTERMVGSGHGMKADTLNRALLIEHNADGTHKAAIIGRNAVINGIAEINQRVTAFTLVKDEYCWDNSDLYGPDRHEGMATGTAVTAGTFGVTAAANIGVAGKAFKFAGVTLTGAGILYHRYRMKAADAVKFKNQTCSFSCRVYHDVGSAKDFTVYIRKANAADNFGAVTSIGNSGARSIPSATASDLNYPNISMGDCSNGIEIEIKVEVGPITTKNVELTEIKFEPGAVATNFESQFNELQMCEPYCCKSYDQDVAPGTGADDNGIIYHRESPSGVGGDSTIHISVRFPNTMIDTPSVVFFDGAGNEDRVTTRGGDNINFWTVSDIGHAGFHIGGLQDVGNTDKIVAFHYLAVSEL